MRILIAGGTGFIGRAMANAWAPEHTVRVLTRDPQPARKRLPERVEPVLWDGTTLGEWINTLAESEVLVPWFEAPTARAHVRRELVAMVARAEAIADG